MKNWICQLVNQLVNSNDLLVEELPLLTWDRGLVYTLLTRLIK